MGDFRGDCQFLVCVCVEKRENFYILYNEHIYYIYKKKKFGFEIFRQNFKKLD